MCKAVGTRKPVEIHAFSSFLPRGKAHNQPQLSEILENHWKKQPFCGVGKKRQSNPRVAQPWDPLEPIQNHWENKQVQSQPLDDYLSCFLLCNGQPQLSKTLRNHWEKQRICVVGRSYNRFALRHAKRRSAPNGAWECRWRAPKGVGKKQQISIKVPQS